jgi:FkbM family methyltransferase
MKAKMVFAEWLLKHHDSWARFIPSFYFPYRVPGGDIYLDISESQMMLARAMGRYEPEKHAAFKHFLREKDCFVDVGVNKGDFTLLAAKLVGEEGRVLAFEPEPSNCHWINKSARRNGYTNVMLFEMALSDENGTAELHLGSKSGWHTLIPGQKNRAEGVITVQTRTLDSVLEKQAMETPIRVMKIDVEGAEMLVLKGAENTLRTYPDLVLLLDLHPHLGADNLKICAFLEKCGFQLYQEKPPFDIPVTERAGLRQLVARKQQ